MSDAVPDDNNLEFGGGISTCTNQVDPEPGLAWGGRAKLPLSDPFTAVPQLMDGITAAAGPGWHVTQRQPHMLALSENLPNPAGTVQFNFQNGWNDGTGHYSPNTIEADVSSSSACVPPSVN